MFKKNFSKKKIILVMTSVFMLPIINKKLFNEVISGINKLSELHFILENLIFKKKDLYLWVKEYNSLSIFSKNYLEYNFD